MNLNVQPTNSKNKKMRTDYHETSILEYKRSLGLSNTIDNVLIVSKLPGEVMGLMLGSWVQMIFAERFILSFEDAGIVMLGLDLRQNFSGNNQLINRESIQSIHLKNRNMVSKLVVEMQDHSFKFNADQFIDEAPFQYDNLKGLARFEDKYRG
ncbi:hypothetical protein [Lactobacillus sp. Sy-1]|uniref:hypothetical protein n=1 Tax=Lactobacillus sp. Sy-1 TaxID=2109645 RepID=UPI001C5ABD83|nr:hypothetical protein [Lactobacillus sp. Sy-1]MBW1606383.1 hypothetical protein [Lactobacillus sp. Sy-1]